MTYAGELPSSPSLCTINTNCRLQTVYYLCLRWHIGGEMRCEMLYNCHKIDCSTATGGGITNLKQRPSGRFQIDSHSSHWQRSDIVTGTPRDHWHWQLSIVHNDVETVDTVDRPEFKSLCRSLGRVGPSKRAEDKSACFPALIKRSSLQFLFSDVTRHRVTAHLPLAHRVNRDGVRWSADRHRTDLLARMGRVQSGPEVKVLHLAEPKGQPVFTRWHWAP